MAKKVILGSDFGRDAFKAKVNDNFTELYDNSVYQQGQIEDKLSTSHNTDANAHDDIRESINNLDANKLEAESGTWTPILKGGTTAGTNTYSTQSGTYRKVGNLVFFNSRLRLATKDAAMAGGLSIMGLPFAVKTGLNYPVSIGLVYKIGYPSSGIQLTAHCVQAYTGIELQFVQDAIDGLAAAVSPAQIGSTFSIGLSGYYEIA